jgi:hypothetical protein
MRFLFAMALVAIIAVDAEAGPFRRRSSSGTQATSADVSTASAVAQLMARVGRVGHWGGHRSLEGCGMGSTPEQARRNCCYYGRMRIEDEGVAQASNGMWFACIRGR